MIANAAMIAVLDRSVPLITDADTGYGGPIMVTRSVAMYVQADVASLQIKDLGADEETWTSSSEGIS
jgi:2-methylisocitrate lyase-like PEP mutase family enzyme